MGDTNGNGFTNKEILIRLEEKVDKILEDHEKRLRVLERFRYAIPTSLVAAFGSAAASAVLLVIR